MPSTRTRWSALPVLALCAILSPACTRLTSRSPAQSTTALNRAKQLALGTLMYANDYDDVFPYAQDTETAKAVIMPYTKGPQVFDSPTLGGTFLYNLNIGGVRATSIDSPAQVPLWFEILPYPTYTPAVGYLDGHVHRINKPQRKDLAIALAKTYSREFRSPLPKNHRGPFKVRR